MGYIQVIKDSGAPWSYTTNTSTRSDKEVTLIYLHLEKDLNFRTFFGSDIHRQPDSKV